MIKSALLKKAPVGTFESLYKRHVQDVYRYCRAMLDRQADAEDATQTTFLNAYRALERGESPRDPRSWLQAIALNVCREHYRRAGRRPAEVSLDDDPGELVLEPPGPELGDVVRGLSCLPFNQREALVMREFEGRSLSEIATAMEVSTSAVEALLFRARRALREQLEEKLTCGEAERAISRQLDGALARGERGRLRAHLRECAECASLARRVRAQRSAIRSLAFLPLPASLRLSKLFGGGAAPGSASASAAGVPAGGSMATMLTGSVAAKVAAVALAGAVAVGVGYQDLHTRPAHAAPAKRAAVVHSRATTATPALTRPRPPRPRSVAVSGTVRRSETRRTSSGTSATSARSRATSAAQDAAAGSTTSTVATTNASNGASSSSGGSAASTSHGNGNAHHGNPNAAPSTPASHGNQKASKGNGNAYGRSKAKGTKPAPATQNGNGNGNGNGPLATPPSQLTSHGNDGNGKG